MCTLHLNATHLKAKLQMGVYVLNVMPSVMCNIQTITCYARSVNKCLHHSWLISFIYFSYLFACLSQEIENKM